MKIDRRCFLSLGIGAAAGTALSPLPWKLMDDSSIWSQMWPWTPVPEDGEYTYVDSVCSLCPGGCGISVRKVNDRAVKIEGTKDHPVNDGGICGLGVSGLQLLYGPTRVKSPMKRIGERGEGRWEKVSWEIAISAITRELKELRAAGKANTVGAITGSGRGTVPQMLKRFLTAYGSSNFFTTPTIQDVYAEAFKLMHGKDAVPGFDFEKSTFVLSFGSGLIDGWGSPVRMIRANSTWKDNGTTVVQVEPRLSNTAAKSDKWITIKPGTEGDLALGIAHVIIRESLNSKKFVDNHANGYLGAIDASGVFTQGFKELIMSSYGPDAVEMRTGVAGSDIVALAKEFATARRAVAVCGRGQGDNPADIKEVMAVHALNALVDSINQPGGVYTVKAPDYIKWADAEMDSVAGEGFAQERFSGITDGLNALFISGANPYYTMTDTTAVKKVLDQIPMIVSFSSFMDESAAQSDYILPDHTYLEGYRDVVAVNGLMRPVVSLAQPVVKPQFKSQSTGDVIIALANSLEGTVAKSFPWLNYQQCLKETLDSMGPEIQKNGFWVDKKAAAETGDKNFGTASGKFEFTAITDNTTPAESGGIPKLSSIELAGDKASYPLLLIPSDSLRLANDTIGNPPFMVKIVEDMILKGKSSFVEINPDTARKYDLKECSEAVITTPVGKATVMVHISESIMKDVVAMATGLGHTAHDKYLAGKGINVKSLIATVQDPLTGYDVAWGARAKLTKA
ncbi:MAG: molybdopterin-dependent oxidoreductase [Desulfobacterales bacterium]|nr:molybdopterin-dependent oxidoreductase [Desulfobacterales bacterium]